MNTVRKKRDWVAYAYVVPLVCGLGGFAARARLARMTASVLAIALACAAAALLYARTGTYCFLIPPLLGLSTLAFRMAAFEGDVR
jgi:hypothetical protein